MIYIYRLYRYYIKYKHINLNSKLLLLKYILSFCLSYLIESPLSTDLEDEGHDDDFDEQILSRGSVPLRRRKFNQRNLPNIHVFSPISKRHWGARRLRRYENSKQFYEPLCVSY